MKRVVLATVAVASGVALIGPAGAQPQQGATGSGTVAVALTTSGGTATWGPWQYVGAWQTDDGATFAGKVMGTSTTSAPPVPTSIIQDFSLSGSNATGQLAGSCNGDVVEQLPNTLVLSVNCLLDIKGASLLAEESDSLVLSAVSHSSTPGGDVTVYRGTFEDVEPLPGG